MARLGDACCHTWTNRERGQVQWGRGEGRREGGGSVNLWFRCDITQLPVSRPIGGTGAGFYQNSSSHGEEDG